METYTNELDDATLDDYDPARRRWLFDPARKHRGSQRKRKGRMPAGLKRYWATHGRGRKSATPAYHPARRRHHRSRHLDPARHRRGFGRIFHRGRRYDIAAPTSMTEDFTKTGLVTLGSMGHNYLVHTRGILSKTYSLGPVNVTQLGAVAWLAPTILKFFGIRVPQWGREILSGMAAEATNVPQVESLSRTGATGQGGSGGYAFGSAASAASPTGVGPAGYIPVWAYT